MRERLWALGQLLLCVVRGIAIVAAVLVTLDAALRPYRRCCFCGSKGDIAGSTVKKYAYEAYPTWVQLHPPAACPARLSELNEYMNNKDTRDPWGNDYRMSCDAHGIRVHSVGEDAVDATADDVRSY